jgi:hypothetical protein
MPVEKKVVLLELEEKMLNKQMKNMTMKRRNLREYTMYLRTFIPRDGGVRLFPRVFIIMFSGIVEKYPKMNFKMPSRSST